MRTIIRTATAALGAGALALTISAAPTVPARVVVPSGFMTAKPMSWLKSPLVRHSDVVIRVRAVNVPNGRVPFSYLGTNAKFVT